MNNTFELIDLQFLGHNNTIASFLLRSTAGAILIETGPYSTYNNLTSRLHHLKMRPEDVKHVLLTHIHLDHAGAAWAFAQHGAQVYVHPAGYKHLLDPSRLMNSARQIYKEDMERLWSDMNAIPADNLQVVEHEQVLNFGDVEIKAWHTPGHARHHIAWQWEEVLFTGDVAGVKIGDGPVVAPCPPPDIDVTAWKESIALMRKLPVYQFQLTHYASSGDTEKHLNQLEADLLASADWIKARLGTPIQELLPAYEAFAEDQLIKSGADRQQLERYKAANPAWMSVAGLSRYWQKQQQP